MRRMATLFATLASLAVSTAARAGTDFTMKMELRGGKPTGCTLTKMKAPQTDDGFKINLVSDGKAAAANDALTVAIEGEPGVSKTIAKGDKGVTLDRGAYTNRKLTLSDEKGALTAGGCAPQLLEGAPPVLLQANELNQKAMAFLLGLGIRGHDVEGGVLGREFRLYHLPDGTPAFPLPVHINEKDHIEIWTVLPVGSTAAIDVVACDKAPGYRIKGSFKEAAAGAGRLHGLEEEPEKAERKVEFALEAFPNKLQCAGTLTYKVETSGDLARGSTTTAISIDPVYRFEWGIGYGFDFGRPQRLSLGDRTAANGTDTEKFIVAGKDYTGAKPIVTLGVDVCGTNAADMSWCDRLLMPTIWVDPTRLDQGFGIGMTFRPIFGVGILAGLSVFKSTQFADGLNAKPGDTWTAAGDLPTKKIFDNDSLGLMVAAVLDTEIFAALVP